MGHELVVGMDIGGTKTRLQVWDEGELLADITAPTTSWRSWNTTADARKLARLVLTGSKGVLPLAVAVGAHGCDSDAQCMELQAALGAALGVPVLAVNDSELLVPAAGFESGIGVVSGTGSIAVARSPQGKMMAAGGWGWILGDEGSAAALVREAARAIRRAIDSEDTHDVLIPALLASVNAGDVTKLGRTLNDVRAAAEWGRHAAAVFEAAEAGSAMADAIIADGGSALAELVGVLIRRGADSAVVVAGGGVITAQPRLWQAFQAGMSRVSPASLVTLLTNPPVVGAVALARRVTARAGRADQAV